MIPINDDVGEGTVTSDAISLGLRELRAAHGAPSFREIAHRVTVNRIAGGEDPAGARAATSSVHDLFRAGRRRHNCILVGEVVLALTGDPIAADMWVSRAGMAAAASAVSGAQPSALASVLETIPPDAPTSDGGLTSTMAVDAEPERPVMGIEFEPREVPVKKSSVISRGWIAIAIAVGAIALNLILPILGQHQFGGKNPLFLDMIGTAIAAVVLGPWPGALVGILSHIPDSFRHVWAWDSVMWFGLVQVVGALIWGYGYRWSRGSPLRFLGVTFVNALACSLVAFTVITVFFGGNPAYPAAELLVSAIAGPAAATPGIVFQVNLLFSVMDKSLASLIALGMVWLLAQLPSSELDQELLTELPVAVPPSFEE